MKIELDTSGVDKLTAVISGQYPFVLAQTLSGLAYDLRDQEKGKLGKYFNLRTKWSMSSMQVVRADKKMQPIEAQLGIRDEILALSATGGTRKPEKGSNVAVPGKEARKILNPGAETLGPKYFPSKITKKKKYGAFTFVAKKGKSAGKTVIAQRTTDKRTPLRILYTFQPSVQIKKQWPLVEHSQSLVASTYAEKFQKNLQKALSTIKI